MLRRPPFIVETTAEVVTLRLDTPGSSVNVFGVEAAQQLSTLLTAWERKPPPLVLLRSGKPDSFVNGAGLLLASAMKSPDHARALSAPVRDVYDRLAQTAFPTVALIEGNCFGCGLELAVACRYRVARPSLQTLFVMTELRDYRFVPLFGGTYRLPRLIGVKAAGDLLLGGETWDALEARRRGLVDAILGSRDATEVGRVIEQLVGTKRRKTTLVHGKVSRKLIQGQPPPRRALYETCAALLERGSGGDTAAASRRELQAFANSVSAEPAKRAMGYFFVRHMARTHLFGTTQRARGERRLVVARDQRLTALSTAVGKVSGDDPRPPLTLGWPGTSAEVWVGTAQGPGTASSLHVIFPFGFERGAPCELIPGDTPHLLRDLARELDYLGFGVIVGPARRSGASARGSASARLLGRAVSSWNAMLGTGLGAPEIVAALWNAGMTRHPREVLAALGSASRATLQRWPPTRRERSAETSVFDQTCAHLTDEVRRLLDENWLVHPAIADVLVTTLFGFPIEEGSLLLRADRQGATPGYYRS